LAQGFRIHLILAGLDQGAQVFHAGLARIRTGALSLPEQPALASELDAVGQSALSLGSAARRGRRLPGVKDVVALRFGDRIQDILSGNSQSVSLLYRKKIRFVE
jgi:hypothetical protein